MHPRKYQVSLFSFFLILVFASHVGAQSTTAALAPTPSPTPKPASPPTPAAKPIKLGKLTHADVGQMHLYCNYARAH